jgi:hypothetical protein
MDDLIDRIENARSEAAYWAKEGKNDRAVVPLTLEDCAEVGALLVKAFGVIATGKRDMEVADRLAVLGGAFTGDDDED